MVQSGSRGTGYGRETCNVATLPLLLTKLSCLQNYSSRYPTTADRLSTVIRRRREMKSSSRPEPCRESLLVRLHQLADDLWERVDSHILSYI